MCGALQKIILQINILVLVFSEIPKASIKQINRWNTPEVLVCFSETHNHILYIVNPLRAQ